MVFQGEVGISRARREIFHAQKMDISVYVGKAILDG